jgi:2-C-methyl-D-erythritol 4-phosphate cytidylyltransferase
MADFGVVILAGGNGDRFGDKKQFVLLRDKPLWKWVYDAAAKVTDEIVVVGVDTPAGATRQQSVKNGIWEITKPRVVILEAARPLVTPEQIKTIGELEYDSCSYYDDMIETPIVHGVTYSRPAVKHFLVPQAFNTKMLIKAHNIATIENATDDTILMARCGRSIPYLLKGDRYTMYKVTFPDDLKIIEALCPNDH